MSKTQRLEEREASCYEIGMCVHLCMQDGEGMEVCTCVGVCGMEGGSKCRREGGKGIEVRSLGGTYNLPWGLHRNKATTGCNNIKQ